MPATMRRVVVTTDGVEVVEVPTPRPGPGEVLVRMVMAGVCGSDTHALHGRHPFITLPYAAGPRGRPAWWWAGDACRSGSGSPSSRTCRAGTASSAGPAGRTSARTCGFFGCAHDQGGMADFFTIDVRRLHVVPDELDWPTAALIEPLSTPVHAIRLAGDVRDRTVAILGAGTIGLLMLRVARAHGARRIVMTARSQAQPRPGADLRRGRGRRRHRRRTRSSRYARRWARAPTWSSTAWPSSPPSLQAIGMANKGGTVVVVGVPAGEVSIPLPIVQDSQLRIQGSATYLPEDFADAMELLRARAWSRAADFVTVDPPADRGGRRRSPTRTAAATSRSCSTAEMSRLAARSAGDLRERMRHDATTTSWSWAAASAAASPRCG